MPNSYCEKDYKKVALLRALNKSYREIERETGINRKTAKLWVESGLANVDEAQNSPDKKEILKTVADECLDIARLALARMGEVIPDCRNVQHLSIATGTMIDKHNLINGDPTEIHQLNNLADLFNAIDD